MVEAGHRQSSANAAVESAAWEPCVRRFEAAWQSGDTPAIDEFMPADDAMRQAALVELVHIDLERRLKRGERARVESYLARYPMLARDAAAVVELLAEEYVLRLRENPNLQPSKLFQRFPKYAEQLRKVLSANSEVGIRPRNSRSRNSSVSDPATSDTIAPGGIADSKMSFDTDVKLRGESKVASSGKPENDLPPKSQPTSVEQLVGELVRSKQLTRYQQEQVAAGLALADPWQLHVDRQDRRGRNGAGVQGRAPPHAPHGGDQGIAVGFDE